ncbi:MAG TPA: response regulator transcription factor [Solirubrobacteraceae bacterium]|nr:response regulator transcription factor [Solirubrobacteraceae bacterium]
MSTARPHTPHRSARASRLHSSGRRVDGAGVASLALVGGARLVRAAMCGLLDAQQGMRVAHALSSVEALEEAWRRETLQCDVVLLDAEDQGGVRCIAAVDRVLALGMRCRLLLLSSNVSSEIVLCVKTRPIDGVVLKESSVCELCESIGEVMSGRRVLPKQWDAGPRAIPLTPRQLEVLKLMAHGQSNEEIARRLGLQRNTVKFHISQIFRRLGVRNRIEAAARLRPEDRR